MGYPGRAIASSVSAGRCGEPCIAPWMLVPPWTPRMLQAVVQVSGWVLVWGWMVGAEPEGNNREKGIERNLAAVLWCVIPFLDDWFCFVLVFFLV